MTNFVLVFHHFRSNELREVSIGFYIFENCFIVVGVFFDVNVGKYDTFKRLMRKF
jgi:hypothetical protein